MTQKLTVRDADVAGKTVLVRVDFNVPFAPGTSEISDDSRIRAAIATLGLLMERHCRLVVCSHLGRPKGKVEPELAMAPVSRRLSELLWVPVAQADDCVGREVAGQVQGLVPGGLLMLENLRFHAGEESNDPAFAKALASLAEAYVNDAFGAAHRAHASTEGVTRHLPAYAGLLMEREIQNLGMALESPERPLAVVLGGAKVSDKLAAARNLAARADVLMVGGGMAATFLKSAGVDVGESLVEDEFVPAAREISRVVSERGGSLILPVDVVAGTEFSADAEWEVTSVGHIPSGYRIMDIGPKTAELFAETLEPARTVLWNGPMGVFEWEPFAKGSARVAAAIAGLGQATTVIGGGSTAEAVAALGLADRMTHVSTGGGAALEYLEGKELPGVAALLDKR